MNKTETKNRTVIRCLITAAFVIAVAFMLFTGNRAYAAGEGHLIISGGTPGTDYTYENGVLTILAGGNYEIGMEGGAETNDRIVFACPYDAVINMIFNGVNIQQAGTTEEDSFSCLQFERYGSEEPTGHRTVNIMLAGDNVLSTENSEAVGHETIAPIGVGLCRFDTDKPEASYLADITIKGQGTLALRSPEYDEDNSSQMFTMLAHDLTIESGEVSTSNGLFWALNDMTIEAGKLTVRADYLGVRANRQFVMNGGEADIQSINGAGLEIRAEECDNPGFHILGGSLKVLTEEDYSVAVAVGAWAATVNTIATDGDVSIVSEGDYGAGIEAYDPMTLTISKGSPYISGYRGINVNNAQLVINTDGKVTVEGGESALAAKETAALQFLKGDAEFHSEEYEAIIGENISFMVSTAGKVFVKSDEDNAIEVDEKLTIAFNNGETELQGGNYDEVDYNAVLAPELDLSFGAQYLHKNYQEYPSAGHDFQEAEDAVGPEGLFKYSEGNEMYYTWSFALVTPAYPITYHLNGGTLPPDVTNPEKYSKYDGDITLNNPEKGDKAFKGWTGTGLDGLTKTVVISAKSKGAREYTAHFEGDDPQPSKKVSGILLARVKSNGSKKLKLDWTKINGADGYDIFMTDCGHSVKDKKVKTINGNKTFKWTKAGLKKKTAYKLYVKAWIIKDGKKDYVRTSQTVHAFTSGGNKKFTNAKSVTLKKTKVKLKKGKKYKIKASVIKLTKNKKLMGKNHAPRLRYLSSDKKVATVTKGGKIKAVGKGKCSVYVYAHNGVRKAIKVTVK